jgi:hypothetical protein
MIRVIWKRKSRLLAPRSSFDSPASFLCSHLLSINKFHFAQRSSFFFQGTRRRSRKRARKSASRGKKRPSWRGSRRRPRTGRRGPRRRRRAPARPTSTPPRGWARACDRRPDSALPLLGWTCWPSLLARPSRCTPASGWWTLTGRGRAPRKSQVGSRPFG